MRAIGVALGMLVVAAVARGQCDGQWLPGQAYGGCGGAPHAMITWDPDGAGPRPECLVVGGGFSNLGEVRGLGPYILENGVWSRLAGIQGQVETLAVYNGELIAGGYMSRNEGGVTLNHIARWTGSQWAPMGAGFSGAGSTVSALIVHNGTLYAGGYFDSSGATPIPGGIARWNSAAGAWEAMPFATGFVQSFATFNGSLVAGTSSGAHVYRFEPATSTWQPLGAGISVPANSLLTYGNLLVASGTLGGATPTHRISFWDGVQWSGTTSGISGQNQDQFRGLVAFDNHLYAAGRFIGASGITRDRLARYDFLTQRWVPVGAAFDDFIWSLCVFNGRLYAGGQFSSAGGVLALDLASTDGQTWSPPVPGLHCPTECLGLDTQGRVLVSHSQPDGARSYIVYQDDAGWRTLGGAANARIRFITTYNGETVIGGRFTNIGSSGCNRIARWYQDRIWAPLSFSTDGFNDEATGACAFGNSLVVIGDFTTAGGVTVNRIALWNGTGWQAMGQGFEGPPTSVAVFNGQLYACGGFNIVGGAGGVSMARWDPGSNSWQPVEGVSNALTLLTHYGELYVGGTFTQIGEPAISANRIAAFNGSTWRALGSGVPGPGVRDLTVHEGQLYATNQYPEGPGGAAGVYRWDGVVWRPLPDVSMPTSTALPNHLLSAGGVLHAAGFFERAGTQGSFYYARWATPSADFNHDGDTGTDQDIEAFFACLGGHCCAACGSADFNADGDTGTDQDIEAFFRVLGGGAC